MCRTQYVNQWCLVCNYQMRIMHCNGSNLKVKMNYFLSGTRNLTLFTEVILLRYNMLFVSTNTKSKKVLFHVVLILTTFRCLTLLYLSVHYLLNINQSTLFKHLYIYFLMYGMVVRTVADLLLSRCFITTIKLQSFPSTLCILISAVLLSISLCTILLLYS